MKKLRKKIMDKIDSLAGETEDNGITITEGIFIFNRAMLATAIIFGMMLSVVIATTWALGATDAMYRATEVLINIILFYLAYMLIIAVSVAIWMFIAIVKGNRKGDIQ